MNAVRRFFSLFRDSPTYSRDQANLLSAFSLGFVALLLNAAILTAVLPLMLDPDDRDFRQLTQHLEFGQLLSLILLGGAAILATLVVPLRMVTVFWGPRIGRYFDQIVLSGISPMKFVIGKVTSQNLFLSLTLFLLVPYAVLALALGGVQPLVFLACLFLVWLYCIMLAMVTLWLSLYVNEMLAAVIVIATSTWLVVMGSIPFPISVNPFVVTPFPALMQPVWDVVYAGMGNYITEFLPVFLACVAGMGLTTAGAFAGIYLGPLFGIVRDNSTFGEVVKAGDATKKRRFRLRHHIQRPSELAFFYENRSETLRRYEGLIRWGVAFIALTTLLAAATGLRWYGFAEMSPNFAARDRAAQFSYGFHVTGLVIHGVALALAVFLFSHGRNTTFQKLPFAFGRSFEVCRMDTVAFVAFMAISTAIAIGSPFAFENDAGNHNGVTVFYEGTVSSYFSRKIDFFRVAIEGSLILTLCGSCIYLMHRWLCLTSWMRVVPFLTVSALYGVLVCGSAIVPTILTNEFRELEKITWLNEAAPKIALASPVVVFLGLFEEISPRDGFPEELHFFAFYALHVVIFIACLLLLRRLSRIVRATYLIAPEAVGESPSTTSADSETASTPAEETA